MLGTTRADCKEDRKQDPKKRACDAADRRRGGQGEPRPRCSWRRGLLEAERLYREKQPGPPTPAGR